MPGVVPLHFLAAAGLDAAATVIPVSAGKGGFSHPNAIHARVGTVIEFRYWPRNQSVVAGNFSHACHPAIIYGFFSSFFPTTAGTVNVI